MSDSEDAFSFPIFSHIPPSSLSCHACGAETQEREEKNVDERFGGDYAAMFEWFYERGLDSAFTEKSFIGIGARDRFLEKKQRAAEPPCGETDDCKGCSSYKVATGLLSALLIFIGGFYLWRMYRNNSQRMHSPERDPLNAELDF